MGSRCLPERKAAMKIRPFAVEEWMNAWETKADCNIAETCVDSVSMRQLFEMTGESEQAFWEKLATRRMTYGDIEGLPAFLEGICSLYTTLEPGHIIPTHGAAGANHLLITSLVEPGDKVVSVMPTYQQLYSIPESLGAQVEILHLEKEKGYLPDLEHLARLAKGAKLICINNPNNPTGALMPESTLRQIVEIARAEGAWILCDEVYRHLTQEDVYIPSVADLYEKGISVSSMSKVFSLAGLRLGWIACRDAGLRKACLSHRDYSLISCGMFDEAAAALALKHKEVLLARSRGIIRENLAILQQWAQQEPLVDFVTPQAGTTLLLYYKAPMDSTAFAVALLQDSGTLVTPGACFGEEGCLRIGYACDSDTLRQGLAGISRLLHKDSADK